MAAIWRAVLSTPRSFCARSRATNNGRLGTPRALQRAMHHLPFTFKRAHHATLKLLRPLAARNGLTPARFDLLYVLYMRGGAAEPYQFRIAEVLGLCRSTICKMVSAMEKAGLVQRKREIIFDKRRRRVRLTRYGSRCVHQIMKALRRREIEKPLLQSVTFYQCDTRNKRLDFTRELGNHVRRILIRLRDGAQTHLYPTPSQFRKAKRQAPPERNFREQSLEWFLLNGFFAAERAIS
ncbi:MAG: helix-turn-helix domain-containing protein [Polyangiaceae bacterium]